MTLEDQAGELAGERLYMREERVLVDQLRTDTLKQKQAWLDAEKRKEARLKQIVADKKEELSVMEVAIR